MRHRLTSAGWLWIAVAALGTLLTAGCAGGTVGTQRTVPATHTSSARTQEVSLEIVVYGPSGATVSRSTLRCDPAGGTHARPTASCRALRDFGDPFARQARRSPCPLTYAGSRTARVVGTWFGTKVNQAWYQSNCGLRRWNKVLTVIFG
jgi:hypothetical protein